MGRNATLYGMIYIIHSNRVSVTFILHDQVTFQPLTASSALAVLQRSGTLSALQGGGANTDLQACSFEAGN